MITIIYLNKVVLVYMKKLYKNWIIGLLIKEFNTNHIKHDTCHFIKQDQSWK